jgi:hypothetical protein
MNKYPLIGGSICAVVLLVLGTLSTVVGYQSVQTSNQQIINEEINQKELLFQTIIDLANNKEIQKIILGSEITGKRFFEPGVRFSNFPPHVLTEKVLKRMYTMGVILSKTISKVKIQSILKQYQVSNQGVQKDISNVIERDATLKAEVTQLSDLKCDCENDSTLQWNFPIICLILFPIVTILLILWYIIAIILHQYVPPFLQNLLDTVENITIKLNCSWT